MSEVNKQTKTRVVITLEDSNLNEVFQLKEK
jgi:hypothetical protein